MSAIKANQVLNLDGDRIGSVVVDSIANMKNLNTEIEANATVELLGYYSKGDGGGGTFYWDSTSIEDDNGGTIIEATGVVDGRYIRNYSGAVNVKWFGAVGDGAVDDTVAFTECISFVQSLGGGEVKLEAKRYFVKLSTIDMTNISILGSKKPKPNSADTSLEDGTVITGPLRMNGSNITIKNIGIDSGKNHCDAEYAGTPQEGLTAGNVSTQYNITIDNVYSMCYAQSSAVHAVLIENYNNGSVTNVDTLFGAAGTVLKSNGISVNGLNASGHSSYSLLFKSESFLPITTGSAVNVNIKSYRVENPMYYTPADFDTDGVHLISSTSDLSGITLSNITTLGAKTPIYFDALTYVISSCSVSNVSASYSFAYPIGMANECRDNMINGINSKYSSDGIYIGVDCVNNVIANAKVLLTNGYALNNYGEKTIIDGIASVDLPGGGVRNHSGSAYVLSISHISSTSTSALIVLGGTITGGDIINGENQANFAIIGNDVQNYIGDKTRVNLNRNTAKTFRVATNNVGNDMIGFNLKYFFSAYTGISEVSEHTYVADMPGGGSPITAVAHNKNILIGTATSYLIHSITNMTQNSFDITLHTAHTYANAVCDIQVMGYDNYSATITEI